MAGKQISASIFMVRELRRAREAAGLSQEEMGKAVNYSGSQVSAIETAQRPPSREYLALFDKALRTGGIFERMMADFVTIDQAPVWLRDWIAIEREAVLLRWFEPSLVPGLLQTEAYARAVLEWGGLHEPDEVEKYLASRMERQAILTRPNPAHLIAIIDENALRRQAGDPAVMAGQCAHLLTCAELPNVHLHIVPTSAGAHAGLAGGFILAKTSEVEVAQIDSTLRAQIVDARTLVDRLIRKWEAIRSEALPRSQSVEFIREVAETWQT